MTRTLISPALGGYPMQHPAPPAGSPRLVLVPQWHPASRRVPRAGRAVRPDPDVAARAAALVYLGNYPGCGYEVEGPGMASTGNPDYMAGQDAFYGGADPLAYSLWGRDGHGNKRQPPMIDSGGR